jgi:hypothetical protein
MVRTFVQPARGARKRAVGQRPGRLIWDEGNGSSSLPSSTRRPRHAQLPAERAPLTCPAPEIRSRSGAGRRRPWLNWREHLLTKQEVAGSSPAGRAVSEAEAGDAPGCAPGEGGFEPRRTPQHHPAALAQLVEASVSGAEGSGFESLEPHRRTAPTTDCRAHWRRGGTSHERCHSAQRLI